MACLSRIEPTEQALLALRAACAEAARRFERRGLTGFFLLRKWELVGYVEGIEADVRGLLQYLGALPAGKMLSVVELGSAERVCCGWELRVLHGSGHTEIGLDEPLKHALRMHTAPGDEQRKFALVRRVVERIVEYWDVAQKEEADCPEPSLS